jgi:DNA topoisomerase VI subunit B
VPWIVTDDVHAEFREAVNMTAAELGRWLDRPESKDAGQKKSPGAESVGHDSGRRIVRILGTKKADLTEADEQHMRKVVGYVHRHLAQRPSGDVTGTTWRASLMNWGHDPLKD